ncbi:nucleolar complex protein 3 homolog isoform X2 [Hydra vulgaris]|uniref:Nucleolar complex protein 3 homolog n=1 Tax=Hydra vulgaris TaxID=6087 RepID=T2M980_HYDVU|nr:nucleolar complex protein 3 homolog isoform X2 [Hydra vulgaris]
MAKLKTKKGNTKSTSKLKLKNKFVNKQSKANRLYKVNKKTGAKKTINIPKNVAKKASIVHLEKNGFDPSDEDLQFSDEEMAEFVNENSNQLSFLSSNLLSDKQNGRRKRKDDGVVPEFEKTPRLSNITISEENKNKKIDLLPYKGDKGIILRQADRIEPEEEVSPHFTTPEKNTVVQELSAIEQMAKYNADINNKKIEIAHISQSVIENPEENIAKLKVLITYCKKENPSVIRKLSFLSLLEVFKDIIPSYRIRELSEEEKTAKISWDVKKIREFEECLITSYQSYLQSLEDTLKDCLKMLNKNSKISLSIKKKLSKLAALCTKCFCELLESASHFNFRTNIIAIIVPKMELSDDLSEAGINCFNTIKNIFCNDSVGDISLEVVKFINKLVKSKPNVKSQVLETFLYLRINADALKMAAVQGNKIERLKQKHEAMKKMSRKEKKRKKVEDKLNKELQEAEAVESEDKIQKAQTELIKFVFVTYFRILKHGNNLNLLSVVLRGLSKFAHLINIEFFDDLMNCLQSLLLKENLGISERLHCISTAFKILSGQGDVLVIDPRNFYTELYNLLPFIGADMDEKNVHLALECLDMMLLKRRKQVSLPQVLGFFKRLSTMLLHLNVEQMLDFLALVRNILQLHTKCDFLLDNESFGSGSFQPDISDPEHSNAESSCLWELTLACHHFHQDVRLIANHIMNGAPSQGPCSLPNKVLQRFNSQPGKEHQYFPEYLVQKKRSTLSNLKDRFMFINSSLDQVLSTAEKQTISFIQTHQ